jgi:hypothetical protein
VNDDKLDDDRDIDTCAHPSCTRLARGGLFCRRHRIEYAVLTRDDETDGLLDLDDDDDHDFALDEDSPC